MLQIEFTSNYNGKLLTDFFPDIRAYNPEIHFVGSRFQAIYKSISLGTIEIRAVRPFPYHRLTDTCAFLNIGKPVSYQAKLVDNYYNHGQPCSMDFKLAQIVFTWAERDVPAQTELLIDWWDEKKKSNYENNRSRNPEAQQLF
jgi:hypothetical protein